MTDSPITIYLRGAVISLTNPAAPECPVNILGIAFRQATPSAPEVIAPSVFEFLEVTSRQELLA